MKQSSLVGSCSYSRIFRFVLFFISFCIFVTPNHARVVHRRLWPWPSQPWPYPEYQPQPWPLDPPVPSPKPAPGPGPGPYPYPCPPIPPKPQPNPPPVPSPKPAPGPGPGPYPYPCPPIPPKPQPNPPPVPSPKPAPGPGPGPYPYPCPPIPPKPQPKPPPVPVSPPCPPIPPKPQPKPVPPKPPVPPPNPTPKPKPPNKNIPAVFFFGDSIFDTGNNNNRSTRVKSNFRPYGMDFPMKVATGRFSNGKVASDYIAKYLGVKETVPAYFDKKLHKTDVLQLTEPEKSDLLTGVSFASGGTGFIPETAKAAKVIPMLDQLSYFQDYKERVRKLVGKERTDEIVSKGAALVVAGGNDILYTYYKSGGQRDKQDVDAFVTVMADSAASFVLQLYGYGVRRIGVVGTPPLGCVPTQRKKKKKICNKDLNYASQLFNSKLLITLGELSKTLPNSRLVYMDIYSIMSHMLETPSDFGFEEVKKPCCKISKLFGGGIFCKKSTSKICSNTSSYVFWDGVHPTERAYEILNKKLIKEYIHVLSD